MYDSVLMVLPTDSEDGAAEALDVAKKLDHEGWIKVIDYSPFKKDEKGRITVRRMNDEFSEKAAAAAAAFGLTGGIVGGVIGGPVGAAAGLAAGALAGVGSERLFERIDHENSQRASQPA